MNHFSLPYDIYFPIKESKINVNKMKPMIIILIASGNESFVDFGYTYFTSDETDLRWYGALAYI